MPTFANIFLLWRGALLSRSKPLFSLLRYQKCVYSRTSRRFFMSILAPHRSHIPAVPSTEAAAWAGVGAGWRQLSGSYHQLGFSFEWHDFTTATPLDWARSFHPDSVEICLNLAGSGEVSLGDRRAAYGPWIAGFYRQGRAPLAAQRNANQHHQFITVELAPAFLQGMLNSFVDDLHPLIQAIVRGSGGDSGVSDPESMNLRQRELVASLRQPPVLASAQALWFQAKAAELVGELFFQPQNAQELFCHRQQRVARDRIDSVIAILRRDLSQTPPLEQIAREVGCSPFYLSRTFSKETGRTIPQYLRQLRLEKASKLLKTGNYNVTEAAIEVGYSSLSHFSQAFHQAFGCCPGLYPTRTPSQRVGRTH